MKDHTPTEQRFQFLRVKNQEVWYIPHMTRFERDYNEIRQHQIFQLLQQNAGEVSFQEVLDLLENEPNLSKRDFCRYFFEGRTSVRMSTEEFQEALLAAVREKPRTMKEIMAVVGDRRIRLSYYNHLRRLRNEGWIRLDGKGMSATYTFIRDEDLRDAA